MTIPTDVDHPADAGDDKEDVVDVARTRLDRRNKELSDTNKGLKARLDELEGANADRVAAVEKAEEEKARKAGEWGKIDAKKDARIAELEAESLEKDAKALAKDETLAKGVREAAFLDKISAMCGTINKVRLQGLLHQAAQRNGIGLDPESPTDADAKKVIAAMKVLDPDTFDARKTVGGTRGSAGTQGSEGIEQLYERGAADGFSGDLRKEMVEKIVKRRNTPQR